jgi:4-hydroxy-4-methyl-2-oxoglutarate aldolase
MNNQKLSDSFSKLSTPLIADACLRLSIPLRCAPTGIQPVVAGSRIAGWVLPVRHYGSVDIFFEAMGAGNQGDVLVIDNGGREDEGCIGDLTALEANACGLAAMVIWGCHRDTEELIQIGFPVFSYGACPLGPQRMDKRDPESLETARFGDFNVGKRDVVFSDGDGVLFTPGQRVEEIVSVAHKIYQTERAQAEALAGGMKLWEQLKFDVYLQKRSVDPGYTFREHLRDIGGAIEE